MALANLSIDLVAKTAQFERDLKRTADASEASANRIGKAMGAVKTVVGGLAGLATVDLFAGMVTRSAEYSDSIGKMAQKIGTTTEEFSALAYAASLADVSNETLAGGLKKLSTEIVSGGEKLAQLGIKTKDASGKFRSTQDVLGDLAEVFSTMPDGPVKTAIAIDALGKSGADLIPLLNAGRQGLKDSADEAKRFGLIVGKEAAVAAEQFNDNLTRLAALSKGAAVSLTSDLVKGLGEATKAFLEANAEGGKLAGIIAGIQTLLTGNDRFKNDKALVEQTDELLKAQNELDRAKGAKVVLPGRVIVAEAELKRVQQAIDLTLKYRKVLDDADARAAPKPKGPAPDYKVKGDGTGGRAPAAVKEVIGDNERALAQYVKGLESANERTQELTETEKARLFLTTLGKTGEIAQVRELVLGMAGDLDMRRQLTEAEKERIAAVQGASRIADAASNQRLADIEAMGKENQALREETELIGLDTEARLKLNLAKQDQAIADKQIELIGARNIDNNEVQIQQMERELALLQERRGLTVDRATAQVAADKVLDEKAVSQRLSDSIVDGLTNGFRDGKNIGTVFLDELKAQFGKAVLSPIIKPIAEAGGAVINGLITKLIAGFADGGIMTARGPAALPNLPPVRAYASGGIATQAQLAVFGEGSMPEAYVPLPDGKTIPVSVRYGTDGAPVASVPLPGGRRIPVTLDMPKRDAPASRAAAFASGGVMTARGPAALPPVRAYASGGVATQAQLAVFGEGSTPEAYVPLPDGKTIPVSVRYGTDGAPVASVPLPGGRRIPVTLDMPERDAPAAFARGGIMTERGAVPLRAYATGGIASTPQVAMYGEGSTPEAFVPLPDGRSIPVTMKGGAASGQTIVVNINNTVGDVASVSTVVQGMKAVRAQIIGELSRGQRFGGANA